MSRLTVLLAATAIASCGSEPVVAPGLDAGPDQGIAPPSPDVGPDLNLNPPPDQGMEPDITPSPAILGLCAALDDEIPPQSCADPDEIDFGQVLLGETATRDLLMWNDGGWTAIDFGFFATTIEDAGGWATRISLDLSTRTRTSRDPIELPATMTPARDVNEPLRVWIESTLDATELGMVSGSLRLWTDLEATPQVDVPYLGEVVCPPGSANLDGNPADCEYTCPTVDPETCDLMDNDCDGLTDEELGSTTCGEGECQRTVENCIDGIPQTCVEGTPEDEICDELDNDCDGETDEPAPEACDGIDNDCDGETDEGCPCTTGMTQPCGTDAGECVAGLQSCDAGVWGPCDGTGPTDETCDGLDNDCDDSTDEDFGLGVPCDGPDLDLCEEGVTTCTGCDDMTSDAPERCDSIDNDCDGLTDEDPDCGCSYFDCGPASHVLCPNSMTWDDAEADCANRGGCLSTINDDAEAQCMAAEMARIGVGIAWVSLHQSSGGAEPAGGWDWTCGSSSWMTWVAGEPNDSWSPEEDCGELWVGSAALNDFVCTLEQSYFCELPPCGNGTCDPGEDCNNCGADCPGQTGGPPAERWCCGNGVCEPIGEDSSNCPVDCP